LGIDLPNAEAELLPWPEEATVTFAEAANLKQGPNPSAKELPPEG